MSLLTTDQQYEFASKIQTLVMFVGLLTEDEIETLKALKESLLKQNGTLGAIGGLITPLEETDHKVSHHNAMIKRIDALLMIHESNFDMLSADQKLEDEKEGRKKINDLFGLLT